MGYPLPRGLTIETFLYSPNTPVIYRYRYESTDGCPDRTDESPHGNLVLLFVLWKLVLSSLLAITSGLWWRAYARLLAPPESPTRSTLIFSGR